MSVGGGERVVVKPGESRTFAVEPREKVRIAAEASGVPELLKSVYGGVATEIAIDGRGMIESKDISVKPNTNNLDKVVVKSVEEKDAVLGFAMEPVVRKVLKAKVAGLHTRRFNSLKSSMGEPEKWKDAKTVTSTFSPYILEFSLLLGLDPTEAEISDAKFIKDNMKDSQAIMRFFDQDDEKRARWRDFTNALERAEFARPQD